MSSSVINILKRMLLPVLIGVTVTWVLFQKEMEQGSYQNFVWSGRMVVGLGLAILFMLGRDFGLSWRFHTIAAPTLSWRQSIKVDLMCAFTSAVTPSAMGGSAFAIFFLNREGVKLGKATTMTLTTLFLDELFFVIFCPIIFLLTPSDTLFDTTATTSGFILGVKVVFWLVYCGVVIWTAILFTGIIMKPQFVAKALLRLFSIKVLRRWKQNAQELGTNMIETSQVVRNASLKWWMNVFAATLVSWFSRYLVVNALFWGFVPEASGFLVFCRQFVVWVILMVAPTPGGSGVSEWLFTEYYGDLIGNSTLILIMALTWRIVSYYIYLIVGAIMVPSYFRKG